MWEKLYGQKLMRMLEPADLGLSAKSVKSADLPITGNYFEIGAFDKFQLSSVCVIAGGDRSAGDFKFTLELYDSNGGTLLYTQDCLTTVPRFGAGLTKRAICGFGPGLAAAVAGDGSPAAGATLGAIRGAAVGRLIVAAGAAYSGGTTDPTTATLNAWLCLSQ